MQEELPASSAADSIVPSSTCSVAPNASPARLSVLNVCALLSLVRYLRVLWRLDILSLVREHAPSFDVWCWLTVL